MATGTYAGVSNDRGKCRIRWSEDGRRKSRTLDISYTAEGQKAAARILAEIKLHGETTVREIPTFGEVAQKRLDSANLAASARRTQLGNLNRYMAHLYEYRVDRVQYADLIFVLSLDLAAKTKKHILSATSQVIELAIKSKYRADNPARELMQEIKVPKRAIDPFTPEERDQILASLKGAKKLFYVIRFYCGLRPTEALALRWSDYRDGKFRISKGRVDGIDTDTTKTARDRIVPVHPVVAALLRESVRQLNDDHIITNIHGKGYRNSSTLAASFAEALRKNDIRYRSPYNCRHTCATLMLEAGMKPGYCAKVLGHSLQQFFEIYATVIERDEDELQVKKWNTI